MKILKQKQNNIPFLGEISKVLVIISLVMALMSCTKDDDTPIDVTSRPVSTLAGSTEGFADGKGAAAKFNVPTGIVIDGNGTIYVTDTNNAKIRKITSEGAVSTFAGSTRGFANGVGSSAKFDNPFGLVMDSQGNLYVAEVENDKIRKITPDGTVTTFAGSTQGYADGTGTVAKFHNPYGICIDSQDNIYVADAKNFKIRKITPAGMVTTFAGSVRGFTDGTRTDAKFNAPGGLAIDSQNNIYVADVFNNKIRKITPNGEVSTLAGSALGFADGTGASAKFHEPNGVATDSQGNVYVADSFNNKIRKITPDGVVSTLAGSSEGFADGSLTDAKFYYPSWLTIDAQNNVYVSDTYNHRIRKITQE